MKCGTATPSCSDAWTQESLRIHSHLPEPRLCSLGSSRIHSHLPEPRLCSLGSSRRHSHLHEARNAFAPVLCPRVIADTLASPRTFANAHHSHFLFTVTRHSSATSPKKGCMASVSLDTPRMKKNCTRTCPLRTFYLSRVLTPSPILTSARRLQRRAPSQRRWLLTPGPGSRGTGQLCIVCHQAGRTNRTHRTQPDS